ncbi:MAG: Zinc ABC transporter, periplasmic-binding protein ZnuA [Candidatus Saccharicenans subterraneus]|uniref:Zinc ABC transporter, periplasmic-binding protein ZnuA n=1 Tax=Candidatus Saccharicenans subterraneus TaxID=2508984 RepID=A0A3E2BN73_9BACT|nr:MAG: Zinc ABC transporter, periplasmic-binding protein ZnuA [Candidatus Saccharicenans subterraneum]
MSSHNVFNLIRIFAASILITTLASPSLLLAAGSARPVLVTTIFPLTELARGVVGQRAEVRQVIPPSAEIHHFQLTPSDLKLLAEADLVIAVGGGLEPWLVKLEKSLRKAQTARTLRFIDYLRSADYRALRQDDPHVWLDFEADRILVGRLVEELCALDPEGEEYYRERGRALSAELSALDARFRQELGRCAGKEMIIAGHQAFAYLATRYGLVPVSLSGPQPEAQPGARRLQDIIRLVREKNIGAVFYESSEPPAYASTIALETGVRFYSLSAGVNLTRDQLQENKSFLELMADNLQILKKALGCE